MILLSKILEPAWTKKKAFVLECDDSQGNILVGNAWEEGEPPPSPWTETLTCLPGAKKEVYDATRHQKYFQAALRTAPKHTQIQSV